MTRVVAVDFFCGAGGMTNGLIAAGITVLGGADNEPLCEKTYVQNRNKDGSAPAYICKDVFPMTQEYPEGQQHEIASRIRELLSAHKRTHGIRSVDLVFAICAPCQPFTRITKIEMSDRRQFKRQNDRNLLLTTIGLIREFRPAALICENVEGISHGSESVLDVFKRKLARVGYGFDAKIVNAANFGVPQNRKRTIGLGFDRAVVSANFEVLDANPALKRFVTVREAIGHLPSLAAGEVCPSLPNHSARNLSELNLKRISCAPPGESNRYLHDTPYGDLSLDCHHRLKRKSGAATFSDTYTRMSGDALAPTITTKCMSITNGRFGHFDVSQNRAITPREAALLQTFPLRYIFHPRANIDFAATLIGNAVPPKLAKFFGKYVSEKLSAARA